MRPPATASGLSHDFPFDPTYGYDLDTLLTIPAPANEPIDFDTFWTGLHDAARTVAVEPRLGPPTTIADTQIHTVEYTSLDSRRIGGWLTVPLTGQVTRGAVVLHGYAGRDWPEPELLPPGTAAIWPCARGLGARSLDPHIPAETARHVLHGIDSPDTYVHGRCAADVWCAATTLLHLEPRAAQRLDYLGDSFGGGIGALALANDDRFHAGVLGVPSFGHHPLRLTMPCTGSGEAVRNHAQDHPEVTEVLAYFDAATAATRIRIPIHVAAALFDPAVPPPGQFAVHNALAGPKELFVLAAGHFDHPGATAESDALKQVRQTFLTLI